MSTLIEGFPDEVSLMVLARVPLYLHPRLRLVCRAWRAAVNSVDLLKVRQEVNFIEDFMCVCSREPDKIWQLYDPRHDVWITIPVLPSHIRHLSHFGAVSTAGKLYVLGGGCDHNDIYYSQNRIVTSQVWSYEPVTRRWTLCAPMIMERANFACGILDGKIIVAGGFGNNNFERRPIKQAEMYDPENDVWIGIPDLLHTHNAPCYGVVVRGKMHVLHKGLATVQILDNETQVWTVSECSWRNYRLAVVGDAVYLLCNEEFYHENQVRREKQIKFTAYGYNKRSEFAMTSLGNSIYLIGGKETRGRIFSSIEHELSDVTIVTLSLEEPWALHHAKPMTRCRGTILGCTPLRI